MSNAHVCQVLLKNKIDKVVSLRKKIVVKDISKLIGMRRKPKQARSKERVKRIMDVAEQMFIEEGYEITTTNAIAIRAEVPIGTLYQFFDDKTAILYALAERYSNLFRQQFEQLDSESNMLLPLPEYVEQIVDTIVKFFQDYPGYHAIFMQAQGTVTEIEELDQATDQEFIQDWAIELAQRHSKLTEQEFEVVAFVLVKAIGTILWLSLSEEQEFRQRLIKETKRFTLSYLQSYFD